MPQVIPLGEQSFGWPRNRRSAARECGPSGIRPGAIATASRIRSIAAVLLAVCASSGPVFGDCPAADPRRETSGVHWYADAAGSIVDREKRRQHEQAMKPLYDFMRVLSRGADAGYSGDRPEDLDCARVHLRAWAGADALTSPPRSIVPLAEQTIAAVGLNLAALKLRSAGRSTGVEDWLGRVTDAIVRAYESNAQRANLYVWAGVAGAANDVLTDSDRFRPFHDRVWREATAGVRADGYVDAELGRAGRALIYHNYLRGALALLRRLRSLRGAEASVDEAAAFERLQAAVNANACDPSPIERLAGVRQQPLDSWSLAIGSHFAEAERDRGWSACTAPLLGFAAPTYGGRFDHTSGAIDALGRERRTPP